MPLSDDDPDKWVMKEHTEVKHSILENYLVPWTRILSSSNPKIHYFDGFAGRGRYDDEEPGSPLIAMDVADEHSNLFDKFLFNFIEYNSSNYQDLCDEVDEKQQNCSDKIECYCHNDAFADVAGDLIETLNSKIVPSFFFIDPFGYKGVNFETVSEILNLRETGVEVFLTFMVRDIRRFINDEGHAESISEILGTEEWKKMRGQPEDIDIEGEILDIYKRQLREKADVEYIWPFEMKMPGRRETVYYLIHATNHFKGLKVMKDVMYRAGAEDKMAYLGPDHYAYDDGQQKLFECGDGDVRITELKDLLMDELDGERMTFWEVMEETYMQTNLIEKHYRSAIKKLASQNSAEIHNQPDQDRGSETGLNHDDEVEFGSKSATLESFN